MFNMYFHAITSSYSIHELTQTEIKSIQHKDKETFYKRILLALNSLIQNDKVKNVLNNENSHLESYFYNALHFLKNSDLSSEIFRENRNLKELRNKVYSIKTNFGERSDMENIEILLDDL